MRKCYPAAIAALSLLAGVSSQASTVLLSTDFSSGDYSGWNASFYDPLDANNSVKVFYTNPDGSTFYMYNPIPAATYSLHAGDTLTFAYDAAFGVNGTDFKAMIKANGDILASQVNLAAEQTSSFTTYSFSYTVPDNSPYIGSGVVAQFDSLGTRSGMDTSAANWWDRSLVDNIQLTVTAVPEPGTVGLLGLSGLLVLRRRKTIA